MKIFGREIKFKTANLQTIKQQRIRRAQQRMAYDAASQRERVGQWSSNANSANYEIYGAGATPRNRARELMRNNPYAARVIEVLTTNLIGLGVKPIFQTSSDGLNQTALGLWNDWANVCVAGSQLGLYGLQRTLARSLFTDGDALVRRLYSAEDFQPIPLELLPLEVDFLDTRRDGVNNNRRVIGGIELDDFGRRLQYWLYPQHPGELIAQTPRGFADSQAHDARDIIHLLQELRPGQILGIPYLAPVMVALWNLKGYGDAERVRKQTEACLVAFVKGGSPDAAELPESVDGIGPIYAEDADGNPIEEMRPGMVGYLPDYKSVEFNHPTAVQGYEEFWRVSLREICAGANIPYEWGTGDLSQDSYSSIRVGTIQFRLFMRAIRELCFIPVFCERVMRWFLGAAIYSGKLPSGVYPHSWAEPQLEEVDRLKEAQADKEEMRIRATSLSAVLRKRGLDRDTHLAEIKSDDDKLAELGLKSDANPADTTISGDDPAGKRATTPADPAE